MQRNIRSLIALLLLAAMILAPIYFYAKTKPFDYIVSSSFRLTENQEQHQPLPGADSILFFEPPKIQNSNQLREEIRFLQSPKILSRVMKTLSQETTYFVQESILQTELYGKELPVRIITDSLSSKAYHKTFIISPLIYEYFSLQDGSAKALYKYGELIRKPGYAFTVQRGPAFFSFTEPLSFRFNDIFDLQAIFKQYKFGVEALGTGGNTVTLTIKDTHAKRAADLLTTWSEVYNEERSARHKQSAGHAISFIDSLLKQLEHDFFKTWQEATSSKVFTGNSMTALETKLYFIDTLQRFINKQRPSEAILKNYPAQVRPVFAVKQITTAAMPHRMASASVWAMPIEVFMDDQITPLKSAIADNLDFIRQELLSQTEPAAETLAYRKINAHFAVQTANQQTALWTNQIKTALYQYLQLKRATASTLLTGEPANTSAGATIRTNWTTEQKERFFYLCALLTATISLAIILYQKLFINNQLNDPAEVKLLTGFPLLGTVPHLSRKTQKLLVPHQQSLLAESIRLIRISLHVKNKGLPNQVLLITSYLKSEGKTFFSLNLGISLSAVNKKVVVLEFNLQESDQYDKLGLKYSTGWSDYLKNGDIQAEGLIQKSNCAKNLYIIRCGHSFVNAITALHNPGTKQLIRELKSRFDYIILDGAVTTGTPDALGLSVYVDTAIFVLRRNFTNKLQLSMLKKACLKSQTRNPMVVFNDVKPKSLFDFL